MASASAKMRSASGRSPVRRAISIRSAWPSGRACASRETSSERSHARAQCSRTRAQAGSVTPDAGPSPRACQARPSSAFASASRATGDVGLDADQAARLLDSAGDSDRKVSYALSSTDSSPRACQFSKRRSSSTLSPARSSARIASGAPGCSRSAGSAAAGSQTASERMANADLDESWKGTHLDSAGHRARCSNGAPSEARSGSCVRARGGGTPRPGRPRSSPR